MTKTKFILTEDNYFSPDRPHISVSMIKDYMLDPEYYKRKWINREPELQFKVTKSMKRGLVVDHILTNPGAGCPYQKKVLKKDNPKLYEIQKGMDDRFIVAEAEWNQALQVVHDLKKHPIWSDNLETASFQEVLEDEIEGVKVCGLADRVDILPGDKIRLSDLKVVNPIKLDSPRKWLWNCVDMKYTHQLALYQRMLAKKIGRDYNDIECAHIVAAFQNTGITKVSGFTFAQHLLDEAYEELVDAIKNIKAKKFEPVLATWDNAEELGARQEIYEEEKKVESEQNTKQNNS